jgi:hypothetical protein
MEQDADRTLTQIPTICLDPSAVPAFGLFNPNDWNGPSRGVVLSCSSEYSVLHYGVTRIKNICQSPMAHCRDHVMTLQEHWKRQTWDLSKGAYYAQVPELHALIEAFFAGTKALLDLIIQLLTTEVVVGVELDGFHRAGSVYGRRVLNALSHNVRANRANTANSIAALILNHKATWIDDVINARDFLVHPEKGSHQLMFHLRLTIQNGDLLCQEAVPPHVGSIQIDDYVNTQIGNIDAFARDFLKQLHDR